MKRSKKTASGASTAQPFHTPFAGLESLKAQLPSVPAAAKGPPPTGPAKAVIRLERKGRSGKAVTVVEQLELSAPELARWHQELKRSLGCGGVLEGEALVFQGDQRRRLKDALLARGVRRIAGA